MQEETGIEKQNEMTIIRAREAGQLKARDAENDDLPLVVAQMILIDATKTRNWFTRGMAETRHAIDIDSTDNRPHDLRHEKPFAKARDHLLGIVQKVHFHPNRLLSLRTEAQR